MEVCLRCPERNAERLGDLLVREAAVGREHERRAPLGAQGGEGVGRQRKLGARLHLLQRRRRDREIVDRLLHLRAAPLAPAIHHPSARHGHDEGALARPAVEAVGVAPELDEDVLERVVDVVASQTTSESAHRDLVAGQEEAQRSFVAGGHGRKQGLVHRACACQRSCRPLFA